MKTQLTQSEMTTIRNFAAAEVEVTRIQMELEQAQMMLDQAKSFFERDFAKFSAKGLAEDYVRISNGIRGIRDEF